MEGGYPPACPSQDMFPVSAKNGDESKGADIGNVLTVRCSQISPGSGVAKENNRLFTPFPKLRCDILVEFLHPLPSFASSKCREAKI